MTTSSTAADGGEVVPKIPNLQVPKSLFLASVLTPSSSVITAQIKQSAKEKVMEAIKQDDMAPFYAGLFAKTTGIKVDPILLATLTATNERELLALDAKVKDAEENLGETEMSDALLAKAQYLSKIGEKEKALEAFQVAFDKTGPLGHRIDIVFAEIRIGFFHNDTELIARKIEKVKVLIQEGGDWDRRNRLKVYEGIYLLSIRDFKGAATPLLDSLATFTSSELMEYREFVRYVVLAAALSLSRADFKAKVILSPEILEVIHETPYLSDYANSLYSCQYDKFFIALAEMEKTLRTDHLLYQHTAYYVREMRVIAYNQLLVSYKSLTIQSMAKSFGVSIDFIDAEVSRFIAAGRINAVIDKVSGIIETNRPDAKNSQYQSSIKSGDILLNRIQKLSRVINV